MEWLEVPLEALDAEGRALVELGERELAVFRVDGAVHAVVNACPHAGNPLVEGELAAGTLTCAYHGWRFDLETGACLRGDVPLERYRAELRDGSIWIASPGGA